LARSDIGTGVGVISFGKAFRLGAPKKDDRTNINIRKYFIRVSNRFKNPSKLQKSYFNYRSTKLKMEGHKGI
jgi:hypothetical protein